ncbi:MAG: hypothetical protein PVJ57_14770 [Phycisphaerae bacterium]|jgi:hypothetical protein
MLRARDVLVLVAALLLSDICLANGSIIQRWGPMDGECTINNAAGTVDIHSAGTFKLESRNGTEPGVINSVSVDNGVIGPVCVYIARNAAEGGGPGASDVKQINLSGATSSRLMQLDITGDLAELGDVVVDAIAGSVEVGGAVLNDVRIGVLDGDFRCDAMGDFTAIGASIGPPWLHVGNILVRGPYDGSIYVFGSITSSPGVDGIRIWGDMSGSVEVTGDLNSILVGEWYGGDVLGDIAVGGDVGSVEVRGDIAASGTLDVGGSVMDLVLISGDLAGAVYVDYDLSGNPMLGGLEVVGSVTSSGRISVDEDVLSTIVIMEEQAGEIVVGGALEGRLFTEYGEMPGTLTVGECQGSVSISTEGGEDFTGNITVAQDVSGVLHTAGMYGEILIGGDMHGTLYVDGDLADPAGDLSGGHVIINGSLWDDTVCIFGTVVLEEGGPFIAVDYDGWHDSDEWAYGACIRVGEGLYYENTPALHLWEISACKGDMNNDGVTDNFDISPFISALGDHTPQSDYDYAYPGLLGSVVYHGDMDCDEIFNNFDIAPFMLRLTNPAGYASQYPGCDPCLALGGREGGGERGGGGERDGGGGLDAEEAAALLQAYLDDGLLSYMSEVAEELAEYYGDTPLGEFWEEVADEL